MGSDDTINGISCKLVLFAVLHRVRSLLLNISKNIMKHKRDLDAGSFYGSCTGIKSFRKHKSTVEQKFSLLIGNIGGRLVKQFFFYCPCLFTIHEKDNCIAVFWTGRSHSLGSCHF